MKRLRLAALLAALPFVLGGNCQMTGAPAGSSAMSIDTDGDGLSDAFELMIFTSSTNADTDGDGLSDGDEVLIYHTDPSHTDTDLDWLSDYKEVIEVGTDPNSPDTDLDGLDDGLELDPNFASDPLNPDTDGDTILDGDEVAFGLDLLLPNTLGLVTELYCSDFIGVSVTGIKGVYLRGQIISDFPLGFFYGDVVALNAPIPGNRTGAVVANLRTKQHGYFGYEGDLEIGGGLITGATPESGSIRIFLTSGFSFLVNTFYVNETADWFVGDAVEIIDRGFALEMLNTNACEVVLVLP
ncbi:MAG: hypothetical protein HS101_02715 [Planctomycetia bacterium]|nr:hypothetical protein [Planctomycetia bacterium]